MSEGTLSFQPAASHTTMHAAISTAIAERTVHRRPAYETGLPARPGHLEPPEYSSWSSVELEIHTDLGQIAEEWKAFEREADCTAFQNFEWLMQWQRHVGARKNARPAIVLGRDADRSLLFIFQFAIEKRGPVRYLRWLGSEMSDYNAPLLARHFPATVDANRFPVLWRVVLALIRANPRLRFDFVDMEKMPETIGAQRNPFTYLNVSVHPSGAYATGLGDSWERFHQAKRSSSTRKRERRQLNQLAEHGAVRFVDVTDPPEIERTFDALFRQKAAAFARMGVPDIFKRPGYREFFVSIATDPLMREFVHLTRLEVGSTIAATSVGLRFKSSYYLVLSSYDDGQLARLGPGRAHLHEVLRYAIDRRFALFDFTVGDEPYKQDWCDDAIRLHDLLGGVTVAGWLAVASIRAYRRAKRVIKQSPFLWRAFSHVRVFLGPWIALS